jgi:hypothetical protein
VVDRLQLPIEAEGHIVRGHLRPAAQAIPVDALLVGDAVKGNPDLGDGLPQRHDVDAAVAMARHVASSFQVGEQVSEVEADALLPRRPVRGARLPEHVADA